MRFRCSGCTGLPCVVYNSDSCGYVPTNCPFGGGSSRWVIEIEEGEIYEAEGEKNGEIKYSRKKPELCWETELAKAR